MKNKDYIHDDYPKACRFCEHGTASYDSERILCPKKGIMDPEHCCRKYVYDPLKRKPMPKPKLQQDFDPSEFQL